jgi:hypothetical protein
MALHRDILWVGRQWAVTGFGVQAIDQRLKGAFDVEISRLWDDGLAERMHALAWLNGADFDKALAVARQRFPQPPRKPLPLVESVLELIQPASMQSFGPAGRSQPKTISPLAASAPAPVEPRRPHPMPRLRVEGSLARFLPEWRVRGPSRR